jgi:hypothetical protein
MFLPWSAVIPTCNSTERLEPFELRTPAVWECRLENLALTGSYSGQTFNFAILNAEQIRDTDYPQAQDFAANNVLQPPSETKMLDLFTRAELR